VVDHTQEQDQEGITTPLLENLVLQVNATTKGHKRP
jgi:hypothetical protein